MNRFIVSQDQYEILQIKALEQDECLDQMLGDSKFMEEQQQLMLQLERTKTQEAGYTNNGQNQVQVKPVNQEESKENCAVESQVEGNHIKE